jgi:hypothetical protein
MGLVEKKRFNEEMISRTEFFLYGVGCMMYAVWCMLHAVSTVNRSPHKDA